MRKKPITKEKPEINTYFLDDSGLNKVIVENYEKRIVLHLALKSENGRKRKIGVITKSTKTMFIKRNRDKHLFRKMSAYGFNNYILENAKLFNTIKLQDQHDEWKIPVSFILEKGEAYLHFKEQGFELQKFVTLVDLAQFRKEPKF
jgi:hypothetical protein